MEISNNLKKRLKHEITTDWWESTGYVVYCDLASKLLDRGLTEDEAFDFLQIAYTAVAPDIIEMPDDDY